MDNLLPWVGTITALAVGLGPGLAILSARPLALLLHRALGPRPTTAPKPGPKSRPAFRGGAQVGVLTASMVEIRGNGQQAVSP
jgi:hypothetical protein